MATQVKRRRGTTAENDNFTGALAEFTFDTETHHIRVHDGIKQGGYVIPVITDPLNPGKYTKVTIDDQGLVIGAEPLSVDDLPDEIPMDKVFGLPLALENKQDKIYAGENIVIDETTISAIDTKYTAGQGIVISQDNVISSIAGGVTFDDIIVKSETIPDAKEVPVGSVYMYMGETSAEYVRGYIYQSVLQGDSVAWVRIDVQPSKDVSFAELEGLPDDNAALKQVLDSKQDIVVDLGEIRSNAQAGKNASDTIATYGDIVTHNVTEFATSAQGSKADTAVQPNDSITVLNNDAGYITKSVNNLDNYTTTTALNSLLANKQDTISDIAAIRSNASAGKSASETIATYGDIVTHNASEFQIVGNYATKAELETKQDVISDLDVIRSDARAGKDIIPQVNTNTQRIEDLTTARFPNVVIVGTPHIEGGQVSNYSDTNYLQFPFVDISRGQPFDIYFSFTTAADVTTQQNILDAHFGIALAIQNGKGIMALSSNGTSWNIGTTTGTNVLLPNTTYYVKYSWTGTAYSAALSTDETEYVPDMNLTSSLSPHKTTIFIGGSPNLFGPASAHPFKGTINFNKSKVLVNGITVWEGMADVGLASRANVSLNNLDTVGEARFAAKQDVISDLAIIRSGAALGATALQSVPSEYVTETELSNYHDSTKQDTISDLATIRSNASGAKSTVDTHVANGTIHVTAGDKIAWSQKQNKLVAGENITIDESTNTISATGGGSGSGRNVGDIFYTTRTDSGLGGAVECNGGTYDTRDYTGEGSIGELLAGGNLPYVSLAEYGTLLSTNGVVGVFGWDGTGTTTFRVPTLQDVFVECGQASQLGNYIPAGLPEIVGELSGVAMSRSGNKSGALSNSIFPSSGSGAFTSGGNSNVNGVVKIDASLSSSIYGNSNTVQPKAIKYRAMVQLFNGTTSEAVATVGTVVAQVGELNSHRVVDFQIPTAENGYTWYRKYADGWVEQGGICPSLGYTVTFPVTMADTNYTALGTARETSGNYAIRIQDITVTGMKLNSSATNTHTIWWTVSGMAQG